MTIEETLALLPVQHRDKPAFRALCALLMEPFQQAADLARAMPSHFDLDTAIGAQLDTLGLWIGRNRGVLVPIPDFFFTWDTTPAEGWDNSAWKGEFTSPDQLVTLPDEDFRKLLKAKVSANNWNGDRAGQYRTLREAFGAKASTIFIRDNQDMTQTVIYGAGVLTLTEESLLVREYVLIRPCGVGINFEKTWAFAPFEFDVFRGGALLAGETVWGGQWHTALTLDADDWIVAKARRPFSAEAVFSVTLNGTEFATITFPAGGTAPILGVSAMAESEVVVAPLDWIQFDGPASALDGGDVSFSVLGYRTPTV